MARGAVSPPPNPLPKVSFEKVHDDFSTRPAGVHDPQARSYGYNNFSDFTRPEHYIRYIEPLEIELAEQVEYDMDEQDQEWLDAVNIERKKLQQDSVSYEIFEIVMDRLEKEWFDLTKNIPKPDLALPSEDSTCAICDDSEGENTNAIVFCDGCNLAVHQDCYGVPYIPEGQWLCRKCTVSPENPVSCILCPNEGGAFKQTVHGDWVHLLCAIWVPETRVANDVFMEPITGIDKISKQRWKLKCSICDVREGACIQCTKASCFLAFHATCARKEKLLMPMKATQGSEAPTLACYCEKHLPKEQQDARIAALAAEHEVEGEATDDKNPSPKSNKTARAYAKTYKPGPPLVPHIIVERLLLYIGKVNIRHKRDFVILVCKYWSLKREARRGAAFLKRLHLEPWTASAGGMQQTDEEKTIKLEYMKRLRKDLESIRMIAEMCRKRESLKRDRADAIQDLFRELLFAHEPPLRMAFEKIMGSDRQEYFKNPVSKIDVPDYYDIIQRPMSWSVIDQKLDRHQYLDLQEFKDDVLLVVSNAMLYNKPATPFYKAAQRIQATAEPILADLDKVAARRLPPDINMDNAEQTLLPLIGDLEPSLEVLELLISQDAIKDDIALILDKDPLASLFTYELPRLKPPPPPPPPKAKRARKGELKRRRQEGLDSSPGFRAPRTRSAAAAYAQFEAEAVAQSESPASALETQAGPSNEAITSETAPQAKPPRKPRRSQVSAATKPDLPPVIDTVDNHQLFTLFEKGWILPDNQKRGNRPRQTLPPLPKKKKAVPRSKSHLSAFSTTAAENETLPILHAQGQPTPAMQGSPAVSLGDLAPVPNADSSENVIDVEQRPTVDAEDLLSTEGAKSLATDLSTVPIGEGGVIATDEVSGTQSVDEVSMEVDRPDGDTPADIGNNNTPHTAVQSVGPSKRPVKPVVVDVLDTPATRREKRRQSLKAKLDVNHNQHPLGAKVILAEPTTITVKRGREHHRVVIIEELDTPAIRKEKHLRRKMEREKARLEAEASTSATTRSTRDSEYVSEADLPSDEDDISELTALSDLSSEEDEEHDADVGPPPRVEQQLPAKSPQPRKLQRGKRTESEPGAIVLRPGERLQETTLVWAKANSYPWWPAVIYDLDHPSIPPDVLRSQSNVKADGPLHLVRFYDNKNTWQWVTLDKLKLLGEDDALDQELLATNSKMQRWRSAKMRQDCRQAFRRAMAERETEGEGDHSMNQLESRDGGAVTIESDFDVDPSAAVDSPMTEIDAQ